MKRARKGSGTVIEVGPGRYKGYFQKVVDGKRIYEGLCTGSTRAEVQAKLNAYEPKPSGPSISLGDFIEEWYTTAKWEAATRARIYSMRKLYICHAPLNRQVGDLKRADIVRWLEGLNTTQGNKREALRVLSVACNAAIVKGYATHNPCTNLGIYQPDSENDAVDQDMVFTRQEVTALLATARKLSVYHEAYISLCLDTGLRHQEMFALEWQDIDLVAATVRVRRAKGVGGIKAPKTRSSARTVLIGPKALAALKRHSKAHCGHIVFPSPRGKYWTATNFRRRWWEPFLKQAKVRYLPPHSSRHTMASMELQAHPSLLAAISNKLGHKSPQTTLRIYVHWAPSDAAKLGWL
jgi:integrase